MAALKGHVQGTPLCLGEEEEEEGPTLTTEKKKVKSRERERTRAGVPWGKRAVAAVMDLVADVGDGAGTHALNARHVDPGAQELLVDLEAHGVTRALRHSLACCGEEVQRLIAYLRSILRDLRRTIGGQAY